MIATYPHINDILMHTPGPRIRAVAPMHACVALSQLQRCDGVLHWCDIILAPPHNIGDNLMFAKGGRMFASRPREAGPCKEIERSEVTTTAGEIFTLFSSPT
jgi:hypothetical protein